MRAQIKSAFEKPTMYYVLLLALAVGFFQSGFVLTYNEYLFHVGKQHASSLWAIANIAQAVGVALYGAAVYLWPSRATSTTTLRSLALLSAVGAATVAVSSGTHTVIVTGGIFLAAVASIEGFILVGISRHTSPRRYGRILGTALSIGIAFELVTFMLMGIGNPSPIAWAVTAALPLAISFGYSIGFDRVFFDLERGVIPAGISERRLESQSALPNLVALLGATSLMKLISLLGIARPKLITPYILEQYPLVQMLMIVGVIVIGVLMDRSRRAGAATTVSSLTLAVVVIAFMQLADSAPWSGLMTHGIGYVMVGTTVAFAGISFLDLASQNRSLLHFAVGGMVVHSAIEAAVMGIPNSALMNQVQSSILLAVLFAMVIPLASYAKNRIWPLVVAEGRAAGLPATASQTNTDELGTFTTFDAAVISDSGSVTLETEDLPATKNRVYLTSPEQRLHDFGSQYGLSLREREILLELLDGHSNPQIASRLYISESTVKFHVRNILDKTGCENRVDVINLYWHSAR